MSKRHNYRIKKSNTEDLSTYSNPKSVDVPKTESEKKEKKLQAKQETLETDLQASYLDKITRILPVDLGVINQPELYPDDNKKDRRYNRAVERASDDLKLLLFFLHNLKPRYRFKILQSSEFNGLMNKVLDINDIGYSDTTEQEKELALSYAMQMLVNSLTVIFAHMPGEFRHTLQESSKPLLSLLEAISLFTKKNNIQAPQINIGDILYTSRR